MQTSGKSRDILVPIEAFLAVAGVLVSVGSAAEFLPFAKGVTIVGGLGAVVVAALAYRIAAR